MLVNPELVTMIHLRLTEGWSFRGEHVLVPPNDHPMSDAAGKWLPFDYFGIPIRYPNWIGRHFKREYQIFLGGQYSGVTLLSYPAKQRVKLGDSSYINGEVLGIKCRVAEGESMNQLEFEFYQWGDGRQ